MTGTSDWSCIERILPLFHCPECHHHPLTIEAATASDLHCPACGRPYPHHDGVLELLAERDKPLARKAFGRWAAASYDLSAARNGFQRLHRRRLAEEVEDITRRFGLGPTEVVIDVGCGTGRYTLAFTKKVEQGIAIGIDISHAMLEILQRHAAEAGLQNVVALQANAENLPFRDGCLGRIFAGCLHHRLLAVEPALQETHRCLQPGGILMGSTFFESEATWLKAIPRLAALMLAARPVAAPALETKLRSVGFAEVRVLADGVGQSFRGTCQAPKRSPPGAGLPGR